MRFPIFALIAPLVTSVVLFLVTGSAFTLLFALLGPVMAVAQYFDGKFHAKREALKQAEREDEEEISQSQQKQLEALAHREEMLRRNPPSSAYAEPGNRMRPPWAAGAQSVGDERVVRLGVDRTKGLPVLLDITSGIAVRGTDVEAKSVTRAMAFQLAWNWGSHEITRVGIELSAEPELVALPSPTKSFPVEVSHIAEMDAIPVGLRYLLKVEQGRATLLDTVDAMATPIEMSVDLLTRAEANLILPKLVAETTPETKERQTIPQCVEAVLNTTGMSQSTRESLVVNVGRQQSYPLLLDLVTAGPHAVVTGMTGSGKTEFLKSWLVALAASYSPDELSFLIIDFKGGAGFSQLTALAHVVGMVTDLDHSEAHRAMTSLHSEIRYRERVLAQCGAGDIASLGEGVQIGRLIVVVDEYRAVLEAFPELQSVFVDLAARGRSLGIHLILSSQRVGGAIGDALMANCALRVGFRVSQKQDSQALLGDDAAFVLPHIPGRAVIVGTGLEQRLFQAACLTEQDIEVVEAKTDQWRQEHLGWSPRLPWLPPLPSVIRSVDMPIPLDASAWLGLADIPEHQVQTWAQYSPRSEGNLLITGPARSGNSNACLLIAEQLGFGVIVEAEQAWDVVVGGAAPEEGFVVDDLDAILDDFDLEHREEFIQCLTRLVRNAPKQGKAVVLGCSEHIRGVTGLLSLFPATLKLQSHVQPGRAVWNGHEVQLVLTEFLEHPVAQVEKLDFDENTSYLVVTHRKRELLLAWQKEESRLSDIGAELSVQVQNSPSIVVGTPDEWMSQPALLEALKHSSVVVLDGCTSSELRGLRLRSGLFPHVEYGKTLVVEPDGSTTRVIL
ncbi:S-DNA-T family DNA segregation ATPase FtsK/SpoIIIE [Aurantimicrobium minutum]|uniref:FtsK/SpoIIIE domain-containing protein n=1 Tax=Aurantimicrobium minutum TaxID=708131 RepID=UPI0024756CA1|nr:FtsK/SpoIIIE domain-containing protein [Aurantimicrobium minutum]MDH6424434.1 S-DNA-T family DNA segregation ATPase FtsK/SpoIIIE [Aurantimicrobium minutum]